MATSGTVSVDYEIAEFVDEAFERLYISPESLTSRHARSARRSMDLLLKEWSVDVPHLWKVSEQVFTPAPGENVLSLDAGSHLVLEAVVRDINGLDVPIFPISRSEWMDLVDKSASGIPNQYWVEFLANERRVHFWQAAGDDGSSLAFNVASYIQDVGVASNTIDLPVQWFEALCSGLAFHLCRKFSPLDQRARLRQELLQDYSMAYARAKGSGHEHTEFAFELMDGYFG